MEADPSAPKQTRVQADGIGLHALTAGLGPPLLLLHGFPDDNQLWAPLLPTLAAHHQVLAPSLRGYGLSDKPADSHRYHIDDLVADVVALIDGLGGHCALAGHDWGGMLAWVVAARHPQAVDKLVIFNAPHPCRLAEQLQTSAAQRLASSYVQRLCAPGAEARLAENNFQPLWQVINSSTATALPESVHQHSLQMWSQPGALTAMLNWYRALDMQAALAPGGVHALPSLGTASGQIEAPTLVLWGELDGSFPAACLDGLGRFVPHLTVNRFATGGHWLLREQPDAMADEMLQFLSHPSAGAIAIATPTASTTASA